MDMILFYAVFGVITVFLFLFFSVFLLSLNKGNTTSHRLLAVFLITLALSYLDGFIILFHDFFYTHTPDIFYVGVSTVFLVGPAFYIYLRSKAAPSFKLRPLHAVHALPFVIHALFMTVKFHRFPMEVKRTLVESFTALSYTEVVLSVVVRHMHFFMYCLLALYMLRGYRSRLKESASSSQNHGLSWLSFVAVGFFLVWSVSLLNSLLWLHMPEWATRHNIEVRPLLIVGVFTFASVMVFKVLRHPGIVHYEEKTKYKNTLLSDAERQEYLHRLQRYMRQEKPFLDPSLDLRSLAQGAALQPHYVSQVLNECLNQNFFEFVNSYRVQESKRILVETRSARKNITQVMYESGFNSKSVFNTAFKKMTGMTPSQYRKSAPRNGKLSSRSKVQL